MSWSDWEEQLAKFLKVVSNSDNFYIKRQRDEINMGMVAEGIKIRFNSEWFSLLSDQPGEIILLRLNLGSSQSIRAYKELEQIWREFHS